MRCYFHLVNGYDKILDDNGIEVLDFDAAKDQALTTINELKRLFGEETEDWSGWRLDIVDSDGCLLYSISLIMTTH